MTVKTIPSTPSVRPPPRRSHHFALDRAEPTTAIDDPFSPMVPCREACLDADRVDDRDRVAAGFK